MQCRPGGDEVSHAGGVNPINKTSLLIWTPGKNWLSHQREANKSQPASRRRNLDFTGETAGRDFVFVLFLIPEIHPFLFMDENGDFRPFPIRKDLETIIQAF